MKHLTWTKVLAALICALGATVAVGKPSSAQSDQTDTFFCGSDSDGIPTTMVRTPQGNAPLIRWRSRIFVPFGWTPEKRCEQVSKRFQLFHKHDYLQYFNTGKIGNEYVVCASREVGGECDSGNILFTILPENRTAPDAVLRKLLEARLFGSPLDQSQDMIKYDSEGDLYINVEEFIYHNIQAE